MSRLFSKLVFVAAIFLAVPLPEPVQAQNGGFFNNLFSGGQRGRDRRAAANAQRLANSEVQTALNFFEFDAGVVDGILGGQSRLAIRAYQTALDFPVTGQLTAEEKKFLLSSYEIISNGGEEMNWRVLSNEENALGVLKSLYLEKNPFANVEVEPTVLVQPPMRSLCVNIEASGPINLVKAQFCNLRQLAIAQTTFLLETAPNEQTIGEVGEKCQTFADAMAPNVENIVTSTSREYLDEMSDWAVGSGMEPETLARISETCLGVGYETENTEVVLASSAALVGLNDPVYVELMGYHIAFGLGFEGEENMALASEWFENAVSGLLDGGATLTGQDSGQRAAIIVDVINILATQP